jgi:hypothetical protein
MRSILSAAVCVSLLLNPLGGAWAYSPNRATLEDQHASKKLGNTQQAAQEAVEPAADHPKAKSKRAAWIVIGTMTGVAAILSIIIWGAFRNSATTDKSTGLDQNDNHFNDPKTIKNFVKSFTNPPGGRGSSTFDSGALGKDDSTKRSLNQPLQYLDLEGYSPQKQQQDSRKAKEYEDRGKVSVDSTFHPKKVAEKLEITQPVTPATNPNPATVSATPISDEFPFFGNEIFVASTAEIRANAMKAEKMQHMSLYYSALGMSPAKALDEKARVSKNLERSGSGALGEDDSTKRSLNQSLRYFDLEGRSDFSQHQQQDSRKAKECEDRGKVFADSTFVRQKVAEQQVEKSGVAAETNTNNMDPYKLPTDNQSCVIA